MQNYYFFAVVLWWFSPLLITPCNYLPDLLGGEVELIPYCFVGVHKRKALFRCQMQEESLDVPVTSRTAFCRAF